MFFLTRFLVSVGWRQKSDQCNRHASGSFSGHSGFRPGSSVASPMSSLFLRSVRFCKPVRPLMSPCESRYGQKMNHGRVFVALLFLCVCVCVFLSHIFLSGKYQSPALREQHQFPQGALAQAVRATCSPDLLALFEKKRDVYPRQTMCQLRKVCHAKGMLYLSSRQQTQQLQTKLSLPDVGLVVFLNLAKAKSPLLKTWQTYRQGWLG